MSSIATNIVDKMIFFYLDSLSLWRSLNAVYCWWFFLALFWCNLGGFCGQSLQILWNYFFNPWEDIGMLFVEDELLSAFFFNNFVENLCHWCYLGWEVVSDYGSLFYFFKGILIVNVVDSLCFVLFFYNWKKITLILVVAMP